MLDKALKHLIFTKGLPVRLRGSNRVGLVTKILYNIGEIKWKGLKPYFIEVTMDDTGEVIMCHNRQLIRNI